MAKKHRCEIISFDSRQFYKELGVAVAKPSQTELKEVPHHFINNLSIFDDFDVYQFAYACRQKINELFKKYHSIVLVGGSGLYLQVALEGLDHLPPKNLKLRGQLQKKLDEYGMEYLRNELKKRNPMKFNQIDVNNPQRLIRAIEIESVSERGKSLPSISTDFKIEKWAIHWERHTLYDRINKRVDQMMIEGMLEEAKRLLPFQKNNALQTVGYKELFDFLNGEISLEDAVEKIKQHTRNYAKRQLTWFKRDPNIIWMPSKDFLKI